MFNSVPKNEGKTIYFIGTEMDDIQHGIIRIEHLKCVSIIS